jgi:EmrB/QacA subfamily drug resistance transporter
VTAAADTNQVSPPSTVSTAGNGEPEAPYPRRYAALAVLCVSILMVNLDNTILNVALPTLVRKLGATSSGLQWIVDAYALVFAGLLLVGGSLADRYGRKRLFLTGLCVFACGSVGAAFSGSVGMLIAWRAVMGSGAAMTMPATLSIINDLFRDAGERSRAIGLWAGTSGVGIAIGPIAGGLLLAHFWWGSVFLVNVPIVIGGALAAIALVPDSKNPEARQPDPIGGLLSILGMGSILWAIIEAPTRGWLSTEVIAAGALGVVVIALFIAWEAHCTHPMLNLAFFRAPRFSAATSSLSLGTFALFGALFVQTRFLQFDLKLSPIEAGVRILPRCRSRRRDGATVGADCRAARQQAGCRRGPALDQRRPALDLGRLGEHDDLFSDPSRAALARSRRWTREAHRNRLGHRVDSPR